MALLCFEIIFSGVLAFLICQRLDNLLQFPTIHEPGRFKRGQFGSQLLEQAHAIPGHALGEFQIAIVHSLLEDVAEFQPDLDIMMLKGLLYLLLDLFFRRLQVSLGRLYTLRTQP